MCELVWLKKRQGVKRDCIKSDVRLSTGRSGNSFNLTFNEEVLDKVSPSRTIDIAISGSRMFFRDGCGEDSYALEKGGRCQVNKYLSLPISTESGRQLFDWVKKYANGFGRFELLKDEKTGLYCIDANGNTTKEDN